MLARKTNQRIRGLNFRPPPLTSREGRGSGLSVTNGRCLLNRTSVMKPG